MTISNKHRDTCAIADNNTGDNTGSVQVSWWNKDHDLTMATDAIVGRLSAGSGAAEELSSSQIKTWLGLGSAAYTSSSAYDVAGAAATVAAVLSSAIAGLAAVYLGLHSTADAATVLANARSINGVSFNGSADITVSAAAGTLTGSALASNVTASSLVSAAGGAFGTAAFTATSAYATAAQGVTADAALAKSANLSDIGNVGTARTNLGLGTLATQSGTFSGTSSGTNTGDQTGVTGNAGTATALQTARNINGVAFDGTANVTVAAAAGTLTGTTLASNITASSLLSASGGAFGTAAFTASSAYEVPLTFSTGLTRSVNTISATQAEADGTTLGVAAFTAADFNASSGVISLDYANGQKATSSVPGFLSAADWSTFNSKGSATSPLTTKGDLWTYASADARLGVGANDTALIADSSATTGNKWLAIPLTVSNSDGTLTISPTTGAVVASLALSHANTWTGVQQFGTVGGAVSKLKLAGSASGSSTIDAAAIAGSTAFTLPGTSGTLAILDMAQTFSAAQSFNQAVAATSTDGVILATISTATVGAQKWSPRIRLTASGWKTTATAGAQTVDWIVENQPVQGTANPKGALVFSQQINGGGYTNFVTLGNGVVLSTGGAVASFRCNGANDIIEFGGSNLTMVFSTNALGESMRFVGDSTGSGGPAEFRMGSGGLIGWNSSTGLQSGSRDLFLIRGAAATLQQGNANAASPVAQTLQAQGSRSGTDSNVGGANYTFSPGQGTGTGTASSLIVTAPTVVASGTGAQTMSEIVRFNTTTGVTVKSGVALQLGNAAVTGLVAGSLAALTNATIVLTDSAGQAYRVPCII